MPDQAPNLEGEHENRTGGGGPATEQVQARVGIPALGLGNGLLRHAETRRQLALREPSALASLSEKITGHILLPGG